MQRAGHGDLELPRRVGAHERGLLAGHPEFQAQALRHDRQCEFLHLARHVASGGFPRQVVALTHDEAVDGLSQTGQIHDAAEFAIGVDADSGVSLALEGRLNGTVLYLLQALRRELSCEELSPRLEELRWGAGLQAARQDPRR